jgi:23S rRNA-/tRNA-specific pseudouridylate synthase
VAQGEDPFLPNSPLDHAELERRILFEREGVIVVDKPWGLPSSGRSLEDPDSLQFALMQRHGEMVWAVHQLDADTSGINIFVRKKPLVPQWQKRMLFPNGRKTYLAMVHGRVEFDARRIEEPIGVVSEQPTRQLGLRTDGQRAVTVVQVLSRGDDSSLLRVNIETGRTHQIRIHLSALGHPLLGEDWYRAPKSTTHVRQALHAWRMEFADGGAPAGFHCPLAADLKALACARDLALP